MGVPQLRRHLEPYAERAPVELCCNAVLDGPALAYHVLSLCSRETRRTSPFEQPSYELLGRTATAWLDRIQACRLSVSAIYFDSYLPSSKRPERIQRLIKSSRDLVKYHSAFLAGVPKGSPNRGVQADVDLFPHVWLGEKKLKPPPPPFLVPAVIDALRNSPRYRDLARLVPGEADGFCAEHVRRNGGVVLTSDSDLLVHNLGDTGAVVFLADMDADIETQTLLAPQYRPAQLCRRLSIKPDVGLQYLAFEVSTDPHLTLAQAIERSKRSEAVSVSREGYSNFMEQYLSPEVAFKLEPGRVLTLDPRISEIALRSLRMAGTTTPLSNHVATDSLSVDSNLEMYLPFLLDCPSRTSAWEASKPLRQLAYAVLQTITGRRIQSVSEMRRLQSVSSGSHVDVPGLTEISELGASLLSLLSTIQDGVSKPEAAWVVLSIYQDITMTLDRARGYPLSLDLLGQEARGRLDECSWEFLHLLAKVQATYYSLRMLSQMLEFAAGQPGSSTAPMPDLARFLSRLPSLPDFPSPRSFAATLRLVREAGGLTCLLRLCAEAEDILPHIESIRNTHDTGDANERKAKKRKAVLTAEGGRTRPRSRNPFDMLAGRE